MKETMKTFQPFNWSSIFSQPNDYGGQEAFAHIASPENSILKCSSPPPPLILCSCSPRTDRVYSIPGVNT